MTVTEMLNFLRVRHNEASALTPNWADTELYALIQARCNQALVLIGLYEAIDTSLTTTADEDEYTIPSDIVRIRRVKVNGRACKYVNMRQLESRQPLGTIPSGVTREWNQFADTLFLNPAPSTSSWAIKLYCEKRQGAITAGTSTINVPEVFHYAICDGVLADMYGKDLNQGMLTIYEQKWTAHKADMREYAKRRKRIGSPVTVVDADSVDETEWGIV